MKTKFLCAIISTAILFLAVSRASANGVAISEIPGNTVIPIQHSEIRMLREKVTIIDEDYVAVTASFIFENTSSKKVAIQMGFPFTRDTEPLRGQDNFNVRINGKNTKITRKNMTENINLTIGAQYDYAYIWDIAFDPYEKKEVVCSYHGEWDVSDPRVLNRSFRYITKTGSLWNNTIEEAYFYIKLYKHTAAEISKKETKLDIKPKGYKLTDNRVIEWTFKNWKPKEDIEIRIWDIRKER
ncbi:MAG: hypothetical protein ACYC69_05455 [Thermodesulfovibrionales bacterium]